VPVVGNWFKAGSCFVGELSPVMELACEGELMGLQSCLPSGTDICTAQEACKGNSLYMNLMPPFLGIPLPDTCRRVAESKGLLDALTGYQTFVSSCTSPSLLWTTSVGVGPAPPIIPGSTPASTDDSGAGEMAGDGNNNNDGDGSSGTVAVKTVLSGMAGPWAIFALMAI